MIEKLNNVGISNVVFLNQDFGQLIFCQSLHWFERVFPASAPSSWHWNVIVSPTLMGSVPSKGELVKFFEVMSLEYCSRALDTIHLQSASSGWPCQVKLLVELSHSTVHMLWVLLPTISKDPVIGWNALWSYLQLTLTFEPPSIDVRSVSAFTLLGKSETGHWAKTLYLRIERDIAQTKTTFYGIFQ